jgi:hypothetical protein
MAVDSLQKQPARVRGSRSRRASQAIRRGPSGCRNKATLAVEPPPRQRGLLGTKPDLALIKQVEQVPTWILDGPVRLCRDSGLGSQGRQSSSCFQFSNHPAG